MLTTNSWLRGWSWVGRDGLSQAALGHRVVRPGRDVRSAHSVGRRLRPRRSVHLHPAPRSRPRSHSPRENANHRYAAVAPATDAGPVRTGPRRDMGSRLLDAFVALAVCHNVRCPLPGSRLFPARPVSCPSPGSLSPPCALPAALLPALRPCSLPCARLSAPPPAPWSPPGSPAVAEVGPAGDPGRRGWRACGRPAGLPGGQPGRGRIRAVSPQQGPAPRVLSQTSQAWGAWRSDPPDGNRAMDGERGPGARAPRARHADPADAVRPAVVVRHSRHVPVHVRVQTHGACVPQCDGGGAAGPDRSPRAHSTCDASVPVQGIVVRDRRTGQAVFYIKGAATWRARACALWSSHAST